MKKITSLLLCPLFYFSQEKIASEINFSEMSVDLADQTISPQTLDVGQVQVESSFLYNVFRDGSRAEIVQGFLRYGVSRRFELGAWVEEGYNRDKYIDKTVQGNYPLALTGKFPVLRSAKNLPDISL